ncbi:iron-sulfur cluster assembly accessory protein [Paenibacillus sp. FSL H8-0537]|uniref:HesB/IscA family protein n=1 Tax=Paenibacillus sp. FSL H8-0537 TaxID=2921399 RepID=UPI0031019F89
MIEISEKAKSAIHQMILDKNIADLFLRVGIEDGGCSGLSYNIKLDDLLTEEDEVLPTETFNIVWDKRSIEFLEGIKIDYQNQGMTGGFTIYNPNAKASCGCGASFRTATYKGNRKKCD